MRSALTAFALIFTIEIQAQQTDTSKSKHFDTQVYMDLYYQFEPSNLRSKERPSFLYNFKRNNEFNLNLALVALKYTQGKVKANLSIMAGNYAQFNLAAEPRLYQHVYEANINYEITKSTVFSAGVFPSHIGSESAISKDNMNLSRSLLAENSPYYETGLRLAHTRSKKWHYSFFLLNGWQNIQDNNNSPAIGTQIQYKLNDKVLINYSTFL